MPALPPNIDHLVYVAHDLDLAIKEIGDLLGVTPVRGGRHPDFGTHNAQVKLGPATYLEIIAPDPESEVKAPPTLFGLDKIDKGKLVTWVLAAGDIEGLAEMARANGFDPGPINEGERVTPQGERLTWKLSNPILLTEDGAVPFLINWGTTPQPATALPDGAKLISLKIIHPDPQSVATKLAALGVEMTVDQGAAYELIATIETVSGPKELR